MYLRRALPASKILSSSLMDARECVSGKCIRANRHDHSPLTDAAGFQRPSKQSALHRPHLFHSQLHTGGDRGSLPQGAITGGFIRVGNNPKGQTVSPPTCNGCGLSQAPALFGWPYQTYINSFYACPDIPSRPTDYTISDHRDCGVPG